MKSIIHRISQIADNEKIGLTTMEAVIGASKGVLSRAYSKGTDIQSKWLVKIVENYQRYNTDWLLTGKGPMFREELAPVSSSGLKEFEILQKKYSELQNKVIELQDQLLAQTKEQYSKEQHYFREYNRKQPADADDKGKNELTKNEETKKVAPKARKKVYEKVKAE